MGQQHSTSGENAVAATPAERKIRGENVEAGHGHHNPVWRKSVSAVVTSLPNHGELISGDSSSSHRSKMEGEVSRMSIRAAIDSFIENCLSAPTDEAATDKSNTDSSIAGESNSMLESPSPKTSNSSTEDNDKSQSGILSLEDGPESCSQHLKDGESNSKDKDVVIDCVEKASGKDNGRDVLDELKDDSSDSDSHKSCADTQKEEVKEYGDEKVSKSKKDSVNNNSTDTSNISLEKQLQKSSRSEKQSFSAFLQDRLNRGDFDKQEELAQLALSKDIKCQEQMIMWEAVKKPVTRSESSGFSCEPDGSLLTSGPVRLQTLIDRVLDSSLNNRNSATTIGCTFGSQVSSAVQPVEDKAVVQSNTSRGSPSDQHNRASSSEKNTSAPNDKRLSFKNHIEKVLIESFLSYEEDERKEALIKENLGNGPSAKANPDSQTSAKECTISVQDLVDQVISHTEMISKLLTPSTTDTNTSAASLAQADKTKSSFASASESSLKPGVHSMSPQSAALIEAQRHMVQKELHSSTSLGRKRGRPQLNAVASSSNCTTELAKDHNMVHYSDRVHEGNSGQYHTRMSPLNYASKGSLQYGIPVSMTPLATHSVAAASATTVLQNRHYAAHNHKDLPFSVRTSLPPISLDYHLHTQEPFHQQPEGHLSSQAYHQNLPHSHNSGLLPSSKALPPLILADQVKTMSSSNQISQATAVPHAPTRSCPCQICLSHFSQGQHHSAITHHNVHHQLTTQDKAGNPSIHPSSFNSYQSPLKNFKDIYPQQASTVSEAAQPVLSAPIQGLPSVVITTQEHTQHMLPASREVLSGGQHMDSNPLSGHHHHPSRDNVTLLNPKFPDAHYQMSKHRLQLDAHGSDFRRLTRDRNLHPGRTKDLKAEAAAVGKDSEQPLDLSVKPSSADRPDKGTCDHGTDVARQDVWVEDRISPYRQTFSDKPPVGKGQCVVSEQAVPSEHHLQTLEKSVDKILPHGHPQAQLHDPHYIQHTHLSAQGVKISSLPTPHETKPCGRGGGQHDLTPTESRSLLPDQHDSMMSLHLSRSPVYNQVLTDLLPSQQQQQHQQPTLVQPHNPRNIAPSPSRWIISPSLGHGPPDVNEGQFDRAGTGSPAVQQRSPSLGPELKQKSLPGVSIAFVSVPTHPQKSPSPEDSDGQSFNISKHEPIQNIIGNHSPTDILYLICRLCRQTYGSPYGFRKHFRNQHGFEPKADHTIVQTISATKTAMAHTEPLNPPEETLIYPSPKHEKPVDNSQCSRSQPGDTVTTLSSLISNPQLPEDSKLDIKKDMDTKCLECPECGQTFQLNDFGSYKRHCRQHNLHRSYGPFACHDCHKSFAEPQQLREHLLTHSSLTPSLCGICHTFFSSPDCLAEHLLAAHGHSLSNEEGVRSSPHSDGPESNRLADRTQMSEHLPQNGNQSSSPLKRSGSFSCHLETVSASSSSVSPSPTKLACVQPGAQELRQPSSSASQCMPVSKPNHWNRPSPADSLMFTVHTPKDLEVEKLPADGIVTTASPDSSFDDTKFNLDSQPASSMSQRASRPTEASTASGSDISNSDNQEQASNSSHHARKESISNSSDNQSKESIISCPPNKEESPDSMNSKSLSVDASHSSIELDEANTFYRHKKYGRHWKRNSASDGDGEPATKSPKVEGASLVHRRSPYSVSSSVNYGVTVQDCQSSSPNLEESSPMLSKPENEKGMRDLESQKAEDQPSEKHGNHQKYEKTDKTYDPQKDIGKVGHGSGGAGMADGAPKFKWDRQTRSQAGKTSHTVTQKP